MHACLWKDSGTNYDIMSFVFNEEVTDNSLYGFNGTVEEQKKNKITGLKPVQLCESACCMMDLFAEVIFICIH